MNSPFLLYHKIDVPTPDVKVRGAFTSPHQFAKQLKKLRRLDAKFYTASEMLRHYNEHGRFPERGLALTFDDGWKDNYTNAFPLLKEYGIKATIFIVPACVGETTDRVTADGEAPREHMSADDIKEMSRAGVEMGSHSFSHRLMTELGADEIEAEMTRSKSYIEDLVQQPCEVFAYPAGFFTQTASDIARRSGYTAAFSTCYGPGDKIDLYSLNRTEILRRDKYPFRFSHKISSIFA